MTDFYLDEDVEAPLGPLLEARGHRVRLTRHETPLGTPDYEQLVIATDLGCVLITHNRKDFRLVCGAWRRLAERWGVMEEHAGVLALPQRLHLPYSRSASEVHSLVRGQSVWNHYFQLDANWGWTMD